MPPNEPSEANGAAETSLAEEHLSRIRAKRIEVARIQKIVDERVVALKAAKATLDDANRQLLTEIDDDQGCLPFDEADVWKSVRIETLGIPASHIEALHEAKIDTLGDIATFSENNSFEDIKGIGPEGSATICNALDRYWELHPRAEVDADESEDGDGNKGER